ncbi:MAG: ABC transporter substrate-binding protein [Oscillospiraceae bacterium]|nr:ABC transporter substrate-binding protein [Oscillospiraceae bacterium]
MKRSRIVALMLAAALMCTLLAGCGNKSETSTSAGPSAGGSSSGAIKVGVIAPLTGDVAVYGTAVKNAVQLYTDQFNEKGGVDGKKIELVICDDKGDPTEAINAYNKLVSSDQVAAILGPVTSSPTLGVAQLSAKDNIPCISGTATHPDVTKYGKNFFRACFLDPFQGHTMATVAKNDLKATKAAIIYNTSDAYSTGLKDTFTEKAKELGLNIVASEGYAKGDTDFNAQLTNIANAKADVLFIPDYYNTAYLICSQAKKLGYTGTFLGVDGTDGVMEIQGADTSVFDGMYFANHYSAADTSAVVQDFLTAYQKQFNQQPNALAALGYDSAMIMYNAISTAAKKGTDIGANAASYQAIIDAIKATDMDCVTGHITFDANNNPVKQCFITKIAGGKYTLFKKYSGS